ncbi:MAG: oxidoreductase [Phenylobacterium sp.]|nr:oxidoreductase [Phenylobacterium sp.]
MARKIEFYFDFGSPNAYLSHKVIPDIEQRLGPVFEYKPALLGGVFKATGNRSPAEAFAGIPSKLAYERLETTRFVRRHGVTAFRNNPHFPVNTLQLMRGVMAARGLGVFMPYVEAVYAAMWERGLKMDDPEVFRQALADASLPADQLIARSQDPEVKAALVTATAELVDRGGFGSPTFFVGDQMFFGKDRLREVEEEFVRQREAEPAGAGA